jgi:hypothetical protein
MGLGWLGGQMGVPLIPSAVTPWLTAFKAYSINREHSSRLEGFTRRSRIVELHLRLTYLNELPAVIVLAWFADRTWMAWSSTR